MRRLLLLALLLSLVPSTGWSQPWSGIISPPRATDWSAPGVLGGIPVRTTNCATLAPGATAAAINAAIAACPSGQVVFLSAGTYNLNAGIHFQHKTGVTLRGAGPNLTKLVFSADVSCNGLGAVVCINTPVGFADPTSPSFTATWTAGFAQGTTVVTLSTVAGLAVGNMLFLDQLNDASDGGGIYVCAGAGVCSEEGGGHGRAGRGQTQAVKITNIAGNQVTITPPLIMPNWRIGQTPGAWTSPGPSPTTALDGVENLQLDVSAVNTSGIVLLYVSDAWVKNVQVTNPGRNHVWCYECMRSTIRDSYFVGGQGGGSQSYGIEPYLATSLLLVENNIFQHVTGPITVDGADVASVYGYNFSIDNNYTASPSFMIKSIALHELGISHGLYEGNDGLGFTHDDIHGTSHFATVFRNYFYGDTFNNPTKTDSTAVMDIASFGRFFNLIGNVLGRTGYYNTYQVNLGSSPTAIYGFGWTRGAVPTDANVLLTSFRWGNYDTVTNTVRFNTGEVPTGTPTFPNPIPASSALPASFYLSALPATWWSTPFGTPPFPPIGPDVTTGNLPGVAGHANRIPARLCYENLAKDGQGRLSAFNANTCYVAAVVTPCTPFNDSGAFFCETWDSYPVNVIPPSPPWASNNADGATVGSPGLNGTPAMLQFHGQGTIITPPYGCDFCQRFGATITGVAPLGSTYWMEFYLRYDPGYLWPEAVGQANTSQKTVDWRANCCTGNQRILFTTWRSGDDQHGSLKVSMYPNYDPGGSDSGPGPPNCCTEKFANVTEVKFTAGTTYHVVAQVTVGTGLTGSYRVWIDGTLTHSFDNLQTNSNPAGWTWDSTELGGPQWIFSPATHFWGIDQIRFTTTNIAPSLIPPGRGGLPANLRVR